LKPPKPQMEANIDPNVSPLAPWPVLYASPQCRGFSEPLREIGQIPRHVRLREPGRSPSTYNRTNPCTPRKDT
jgi:hypothetical protein